VVDGRAATLRRGVRVIRRAMRDEPVIVSLAVGGSLVYAAGTVAGGLVLGRLTTSVLEPVFRTGELTTEQAWTIAASLLGVAVITSLGVVVRRIAAGLAMFRLQARYRRAVTRQYLRLPLAWHRSHPAGQLLSNANADVEATFQFMAPLPMALGVAAMLVFGAVAMIAADPVLGIVGLLVLPALAGINGVYQHVMAPRAILAQHLRADVSTVAHESFEGALVVKALGREATETARFADVAGQLRDANVGVGRLRGVFDPVLEALPTLGTLAVLGVGAVQVANGHTTTGDVVQIAYLLTLLGFPVRAFGWLLGELPRAVVGWERVSAVLDADATVQHATTTAGPVAAPVDPAGAPAVMRLADVVYLHPDGMADAPALSGITLDIHPGRTVAVVGPTGSGKSTLAGLLLRLVDPHTGAVLLDGVDLRALARGELARSAALVTQTAFVFDDTVRDNVTLGSAISDDEVWRALRRAEADDFVRALPDGLDARVGERGTALSGGQRQRLALSRALLRSPRLLVLDDATSAVDPHVEAAILAQLRSAGGPGEDAGQPAPALVVIASRMATIALADEVVWIERGRVGARGTHAEVYAAAPAYRDLVTAYAAAEETGDEQPLDDRAGEVVP